jgi:hypothetical protein
MIKLLQVEEFIRTRFGVFNSRPQAKTMLKSRANGISCFLRLTIAIRVTSLGYSPVYRLHPKFSRYCHTFVGQDRALAASLLRPDVRVNDPTTEVVGL